MTGRRPRLLYLSPEMKGYSFALYQHDVMRELERHADVHFAGPGFSGFTGEETLDDLLARAPWRPDWIIVGHAWLEDGAGKELRKFPRIDLSRCPVPKAIILNKEYARLEEKLAYIAQQRFDIAFSHHHDAVRYAALTGVPFVFWPFAADHRRFVLRSKTADLGFSGILQNPTPGKQSDLRVRLMREVFHCLGDVPLARRWGVHDLAISWNALPRTAAGQRLAARLGRYRRHDIDAYAAMVGSCRAFVCTRSPADLISTRYFECMCAGTLVVAEKSPAHAQIFANDMLAEFTDERDFLPVLRDALRSDAWAQRTSAARAHALAHHTWERRIGDMLRALHAAEHAANNPRAAG